MNKVQLIQRVAKEARVKKSQASRSVKSLVKTIREALRVGDFCGTVTGTTTITDSPTGGLLLVLGARGAITGETGS